MCVLNHRMLHQWTSEYYESTETQESRVRILSQYMEKRNKQNILFKLSLFL